MQHHLPCQNKASSEEDSGQAGHLSGGSGLLLGKALVVQGTYSLLVQSLQLCWVDRNLHIWRPTPAHQSHAFSQNNKCPGPSEITHFSD